MGSLTLLGAGSPSPSTGASSSPLLVSLEAYYRFDANRNDFSGNGRTLSGGGLGSGVGQGAINSNGWMNASSGSVSGLSVPSTALSLSVWYKYGSGSITGVFALQNGGNNKLAASFALLNLQLKVNNSTTGSSPTQTPRGTANVWHHILVTYDNGSSVLYHDGVARITNTTIVIDAGTIDGWTISLGSNQLWDEAAVWSRVLSAPEVAQLYNNGSGYDPTA